MGSSFPVSSVPDLLTVEGAARVLGIGRTKAYAPTQAWRDSEGELGILVTGARLEPMIGAPILSLPAREPAPTEQETSAAPEPRSIDGALADTGPAENAADGGQNVLPFSA